MVTQAALFDTNILIDHLNGVPQSRLEIERYADRAISIITWMEVLAGSDASTEKATRALLRAFLLLSITPEIAERAAEIRRKRTLKLPDAIIFATAEKDGRILVTRNSRDFDSDDPNVHVPYRL